MSSLVACSISYTLDKKSQSFILDSIEDIDVSLSSTITTHPVADGDLVADHMYKEPLSITLRGSFGVNASNKFSNFTGPASLGQIQRLIERIKNEAVICTLVKFDNSIGPNYPTGRFLVRQNLVLSNISWTEKINSLGFTFTFTEVMITKLVTYEVNTDDRFLPSIEVATQSSFAQEFLDWSRLDAFIMKIMSDKGLVTDDFLRSYAYEAPLIAAGSLAALAGGAALALGATGPAGWLVLAGVVGLGAIGVGIYRIFDNITKERNFREKVFKDYKKDKQRFENFVGIVHQQVVNFVNNIGVWNIDLGENREGLSKSIAVNVFNDYYVLDFTRKNTLIRLSAGTIIGVRDVLDTDTIALVVYSLKVSRYLNGEPYLVGTVNDANCTKTSFDRCTLNDAINKNRGDAYSIYLLQRANWKTLSNGLLVGETQNGKYHLIASALDPQEYWNGLRQVVLNSFMRNPS